MDTLRLFRNADNVKTFEAGDVIFRQDEPGDMMYVVMEGEVEILVGDKLVDTTGSGGIVGEMALIDAQARSATARARTRCKLVPVTQRKFMFLVEQTPFFAIHVMQLMSERLRKMLQAVQSPS